MKKKIRTIETMAILEDTGFKMLAVQLSHLTLKITTADVDKPHIYYPITEMETDRQFFALHFDTNKDCFNIRESGQERGLFRQEYSLEGVTEVRLVLPEDRALDLVDINIAMGSATIESLKPRELMIDLSMGSLSLTDVEAVHVNISLSMGAVKLLRTALRQGAFDLSMGSLSGLAAIGGLMELSLSMGSVDLTLRQDPVHLSYELHTSMGGIRVAGQKLPTNAVYVAEQEHAKLVADLSMGSITLNFD